ncbi:glycosyltransferase family 39 protein [Clostridium felsineum]|uniref:glycosyltransferase family 39 protein n=1 Tax=Clostridium felsineum TaxID=36839 RepID=UPI00098CADF8|nr:glycosyltransferase family 39 protein [Clostridium felsineum]URZ18343.1 Undecaprenyl phosphate-alpha-4-amino-4-deoxy-L-arabinose arabinosyl transferase [Clostridium felsineum DSM 794]
MNKKIELTRENIFLSLILLLSAVLNFANIGIEGYANTFYAAGVKSMLMNFKNFFFASFDPSGFVTIDKPPLGFWIQTIFAKIFGFSGWSIILPQAIAGVLSVFLLYHLVKRSFGKTAGLIAALCLATTPIFVAASRNNTIDNLLVLALVLSCFPLFKAAENGKLKYLLLSLVLVGIGFNIKMVEAYMIAPAIYITYFLSAALPFKKKFQHLVLGTVVLLVVSLSWAVVTDLVPTKDRPYIGSSTDNSVIQLIVGHNGLQRVGVNVNSIGRRTPKHNSYKNKFSTNNMRAWNPPKGFNDKFAKRNMGNQISKAGITRLFSKNNMSDQISWLLPFALIGFVVAAIQEKLKLPFDNKRKLALLFWFTWLLPEFIYFSFSKSVTHTYYMTTMAPPIAALTGIGLVSMCREFKKEGIKKWILPASLIVNSLIEILMLSYNSSSSNGYKMVMLLTGVLGIAASIILILLRNNSLKDNNLSLSKNVIAIAFAGILIAPTVWSISPMFHKMNGSSPSAGLELFKDGRISNSINYASSTNSSKLIKFLDAHDTNEKYFVEVPSAMTYGSDLILNSGKPVLTLGGFSGSDPILTLDQFKKLVNDGDIRYAMASTNSRGGMGFGGGRNSNTAIMDWIKTHGKIVPSSEWMSSGKNSKKLSSNSREGAIRLYDLKAESTALK